ncbi:MAG TPA: hypothetical protein VE954_41850 [Oligoflexus sp.]|uniref:hypothetical protein n=1 Tax=Oligoflexus sp. TaxID=1971216 RepID=UPI002D45328A|nr:hypothetical protein [Oligoflexus sp.]HYX39687.1 hypothetical protein [Oligoflexus sp.]
MNVTSKNIIVTAALFPISIIAAYGGGSMGGGGPPALDQLEQMLMTNSEAATAGLFTTEAGSIGLGVRGALDKKILLSKASVAPQSLKISESDFNTLDSSKFGSSIDAVSFGNDAVSNEEAVRSYQISDGDKPGELILNDRREIMRAAIR